MTQSDARRDGAALLQAALNGARTKADYHAVPVSAARQLLAAADPPSS